jgi:drug/metabolite transporter (DMT)-like permease
MQGPWRPAAFARRWIVAAPLALALGAVLLWSTNAAVGGAALRALSVPQLLLVQFASAAALLGGHRSLAARPAGGRSRLSWQAALLACVGVTGTMTLQYVGFANAPLVQANVVAYAWPLLAPLALAASARTRSSIGVAGLAAVGFLGVGLMLAAGGSPAAAAGDPLLGYLAAGGSALAMAAFTLGAGRFEGDQGGALLLATCVGAAGALAIAIADGTSWPGGTGWLAAVYLGVGPMALGYLLWSRAMASARGRRLAPLGYATPVLSTALLRATGHPIATTGLLGAALALGSTAGVLRLGRDAAADRAAGP